MIEVSISCVTFNHEKFILDTLIGIDKQITDFEFELNICDDGSKDRTLEIVKEFNFKNEKLHVNIIENDTNLGSMMNFKKSMELSKGKYIAICAGDDYWLDEKKLQKQFDIMEEDDFCTICFHDCYKVDDNKNILGNWNYTERCLNKKVSLDDLFNFEKPVFIPYVPSYFLRKSAILPLPSFFVECFAEDMVYICLSLDKGYGICLNEKMAAYRKNNASVTSEWRNSKEKFMKVQKNAINTYRLLDEYTCNRHHKLFTKEINKVYIVNGLISHKLKFFINKNNIILISKYLKLIDYKTILKYWTPNCIIKSLRRCKL